MKPVLRKRLQKKGVGWAYGQVAEEIWVCDRGITTWKGDIRQYKKKLAKNLDL